VSVVICHAAEYLLRRIAHCPTCKTKRRFSGGHAVWYGTTWSCCGCGDTWTDGERHQRPFRRGWRTKAVAEAKRLWADAGPFDREAYDRWCSEQLGWDAR
jgi:hypothetical protein